MRPALCRLFLCALRHDAEVQEFADRWETRCLHCRARLQFARSGEPLGAGSLEHVIPQAWFGKRAATELCATVENDPNHPRNLAVACGRCNQSKGKGPDARGPADPRALQVITTMLARADSRAGGHRPERRIDKPPHRVNVKGPVQLGLISTALQHRHAITESLLQRTITLDPDTVEVRQRNGGQNAHREIAQMAFIALEQHEIGHAYGVSPCRKQSISKPAIR